MALFLEGSITIRVHDRTGLAGRLNELRTFVHQRGSVPLSRDPAWPVVLEDGLRHHSFTLEAVEGGTTVGYLSLVLISTPWFGRFLVSLPYLNYGGVEADDQDVIDALIEKAVVLAAEFDVRYLELRNRHRSNHQALTHRMGSKVHMKLPLPATASELWEQMPSKVRNQIRKGHKSNLKVAWGGESLLGEFYSVFSRNMRDLGTPVYGQRLFASILRTFPEQAEICVVRHGHRPVAAALLLHGRGITEVPSASSLREFNPLCPNMLMYYNLLERAVGRGQQEFDFGRSSLSSRTFDFKQQWGAKPEPSDWQYHVRVGGIGDMRPENPRYHWMIAAWKRLPVPLTQLLGPPIIRGIP